MSGPTPTRRQLIAGGLGLAAGLAAAPAPAEGTAMGTSSTAATAHDRRILERLLKTERLLEFAYEQAISSGKLKQVSQQIVLMNLDQEFAHANAISVRLASMPTPPLASRSRRNAAHPEPFPPPRVTALFKQIKTEAGVLGAVVEIENLAESSYFNAVAGLHDPALIRMASEILANEAQHWTLLVSLLHKGRPEASVPHPAVRGSQQLRPLKQR